MTGRRAWMAAALAAGLVGGCGGENGDGDTADPQAGQPTASATGGSTGGSTDGATDEESARGAMTVNEEVRQVCQDAVSQALAGAEFETRSTLRAASSAGGKTYTVTGSAQAEGTGHPYSCDIEVADGEVTLSSVTVDGQSR